MKRAINIAAFAIGFVGAGVGMIALGVSTHQMQFVIVGILICCVLSVLTYLRQPHRAARIHAWRHSGSRSVRIFGWFVLFLSVCTMLHMILTLLKAKGSIE